MYMTRRNRVGTNQYKVKKHKNVGAYMLTFVAIMNIMMFVRLNDFPKYSMISPLAYASTAPAIATESATLQSSDTVIVEEVPVESPQEDIEKYIKTIFRGNSKMAIEVTHHECSPQHKLYPRCEKNDNIEWSCGIWQINLRDPNTMKLIHAAKIPGETLEEKCEWLKDPYQSTLVAYYIYSHQDFCPWTWYKNNYCK